MGFLVKENRWDIIEVIRGTNFDEKTYLVRIKIPGGRGEKYNFLDNIYMPPESKSTVKDIRRKFGRVAVDVQKYKRQEEVVVGDFDSRLGKARNPNRTLDTTEK